MNASQIANELFELNIFQTYKNLEHKLDIIKESMKHRMFEDEKRRVFVSQDVVAKYIHHNKYSVDLNGLQDLLDSYGLLVHTSVINTDDQNILDMISEFKNEQTYHIRINAKVAKEEFNFDTLSDSELAQVWFETHALMKRHERKIIKAKAEMMKCEILNKDKSVKFAYGSISKVRNKVTYDMEKIHKKYGLEFIKKWSNVSSEKVDSFIEQGFIEHKEVEQFKKLIDVGLKFVIMTLTDENFVMNIMKEKLMKGSLNRNIA